MAIAHLDDTCLRALRRHGHPHMWEVVSYGGKDEEDVDSVTVECTRCGEVLIELVHEEEA